MPGATKTRGEGHRENGGATKTVCNAGQGAALKKASTAVTLNALSRGQEEAYDAAGTGPNLKIRII
jgi:hypothetical protein